MKRATIKEKKIESKVIKADVLRSDDADQSIDRILRPKDLTEYIGQKKVKKNISIFVEAAKKRNEPIDHILFYGGPGLGKTSLAIIVARMMQTSIRITSGPAIERPGDLGAILTNLKDKDILFIDEIHRLPKTVQEVLYPAMEDYVLDIVVGKGPAARTIRLDLPKFTIIGATTRIGLLTPPFRDRFGIAEHFTFYNEDEIETILERSSRILGVKLTEQGKRALAERSRFTPRIANRLLKRVRDYAQVRGEETIDGKIAKHSLDSMEVDAQGLDHIDREILRVMIEKFDGGPIGVRAIAHSVSEDALSIEDVFEPFLLKIGFIARTPRGRIVTQAGFHHMGMTPRIDIESKLL